jgi:HSP20 family molecular chaperone IbpA
MFRTWRDNYIFLVRRTLACLLLVSGVGLSAQKSSATSQTNPAAAQSTERLQPIPLTQSLPCSPNQPPAYKPLRYEEDYSYLKDPDRRTDLLDALKYIPLSSREGWYLSLGGEIRERYEFFHNEESGSQPANRHGNNSYALQRYLLHGDLHLGSHFRFFLQVVSGLENGRIGGPRPDIDRDIFDVHEAELQCLMPIGILESSERLEVNIGLPGFHAHEIEVGIEPRRLFIRARKEKEASQKSNERNDTEPRFDGVFRALNLPDQVDPTRVTATFAHGNLYVMLSRVSAQALNPNH